MVTNVEHDEITPTSFKYRLGDLEKQLRENHSELLSRIGRLEGKMDIVVQTLNHFDKNNAVEHVGMKKDIEANQKGMMELTKGVLAFGMIAIAGVINFVFGIIAKK